MDGCLLIGGKAPDKNLLGPRMNDWDIIIAADLRASPCPGVWA